MSDKCTIHQDDPRLCQLKRAKAKRTGEPFACTVCHQEPIVQLPVCRGCGEVIEPKHEKSQGMHKSCHIRLYTEWSQSGVSEPFDWWLERRQEHLEESTVTVEAVVDSGEDCDEETALADAQGTSVDEVKPTPGGMVKEKHSRHLEEEEGYLGACQGPPSTANNPSDWPDLESLPIVSGWKCQPATPPECWCSHGRLNFSSSAVRAFKMQRFSHCRVRYGNGTMVVELLKGAPAEDKSIVQLNKKTDGCNIYASLVRFLRQNKHLLKQRVRLHQLREDVLAARFEVN